MYQCKFGQNPSSGSEDKAQKSTEAMLTQILMLRDPHQKQHVPRSSVGGDIIQELS